MRFLVVVFHFFALTALSSPIDSLKIKLKPLRQSHDTSCFISYWPLRLPSQSNRYRRPSTNENQVVPITIPIIATSASSIGLTKKRVSFNSLLDVTHEPHTRCPRPTLQTISLRIRKYNVYKQDLASSLRTTNTDYTFQNNLFYVIELGRQRWKFMYNKVHRWYAFRSVYERRERALTEGELIRFVEYDMHSEMYEECIDRALDNLRLGESKHQYHGLHQCMDIMYTWKRVD